MVRSTGAGSSSPAGSELPLPPAPTAVMISTLYRLSSILVHAGFDVYQVSQSPWEGAQLLDSRELCDADQHDAAQFRDAATARSGLRGCAALHAPPGGRSTTGKRRPVQLRVGSKHWCEAAHAWRATKLLLPGWGLSGPWCSQAAQ